MIPIRLLALTAMTLTPLTQVVFAQGFNGPGRYQIRNVETLKPLDLNGDRLIQNSANNSRTQIWEFQQAGPDVFYIRNGANGCSLEMTQDRNGAPVICPPWKDGNPSQHWRIEPLRDGYLIISRFRKPLDTPGGSRRDGEPLQIYDRNGEGNQRFIIERVALGGDDRDRDRGRDTDRRGPHGAYFDRRDQLWKVDGDGVCFYRATDFRGEALCAHAGEDLPDVRREGGGVFLSMKLFGRARTVEIFEREAFRGRVVRLGRDEANLRRIRADWSESVADAIGSFRINQ
jgi:hypothetical protein